MKRREFIKSGVGSAIAAGVAIKIGTNNPLYAMGNPYDLVAVKGGSPEAMFDKAIASMGGMQAFVKKGQTVVVKPNMGWDVPPERGGNTHPNLIKRIIEHCFNAGAKSVYVFDNTCDNWQKCYETSGIQKAAKDAGAKVVTGASESNYHEVEVRQGKVLKKAKVHELILESNVFINVPILKSHSSAKLTIGMKNQMGIVWDRRFWHRNDLHRCIADFASFKKPDLNVIDAYYVMKRNGPRGVSVDDVITMKSQILSRDIVAADAASVKLFGMEPDDVEYIKLADAMKVGTKDLSKLNINRIKM
jgi:uncharacterized protein (DUF362 family)